MAKKDSEEVVQARVLTDFGDLRCNSVVSGSAESIKALVDAGVADSSPEAVAYAIEQGASEVQI